MKKAVTVVITGAEGHLGGALLSLLAEQNVWVRALTFAPLSKRIENPRISYIQGDVRKPESLAPLFAGLEGEDFVVIHLAAIIDIQHRYVTPEIRAVNVGGLHNVWDYFVQFHGRRFIYVSSVDAFLQTSSLINEDAPYVSDNGRAAAYPVTKAIASNFIKDKQKEGYDAIIVYPSGIIGPGDTGRNHLVQLMRDYLLGKMPGVIPSGYDVVDVRDVAEGIWRLSQGDHAGDAFLLSGHEISLKDLLLLAKQWNGGNGNNIRVYPFWLARAGLPFIHLHALIHHQRPLYTGFAISVVKHANQFDHTRASRAIGYQPRPIAKSVSDTLDYLREEKIIP